MEYQFTSENFETEVLQSKLPVLVDFYADWCGPCKMMGPIVAELAKELDGRVKVGKLNVDDTPEIAARYKVMSIPTFLIVKDGEVKATITGAVSKSELINKLEQVSA